MSGIGTRIPIHPPSSPTALTRSKQQETASIVSTGTDAHSYQLPQEYTPYAGQVPQAERAQHIAATSTRPSSQHPSNSNDSHLQPLPPKKKPKGYCAVFWFRLKLHFNYFFNRSRNFTMTTSSKGVSLSTKKSYTVGPCFPSKQWKSTQPDEIRYAFDTFGRDLYELTMVFKSSQPSRDSDVYTDQHADTLADALAQYNGPLERLNLNGCGIDDKGIIKILAAIKNNEKLNIKHIDLRMNCIKRDGEAHQYSIETFLKNRDPSRLCLVTMFDPSI